MSVKLMARVWDLDLSASETLVLLCLADFADDEGGNCYPAMATIARRSKITERHAMRVVSSLESRGLLSVDRTGRHNRYRIVLSDVTGDILSQVTSETRQVTSETRQVTSETATGVVDVTLSIKEPLEPPVVTPPTPPRSLQDSSFEEFWTFYPRKVGKPDARRAYAKALDRTGSAMVLNEAAARYAGDPNLPPEQFIPHPATWLNRDGWNDGPCPPRGGRLEGEALTQHNLGPVLRARELEALGAQPLLQIEDPWR